MFQFTPHLYLVLLSIPLPQHSCPGCPYLWTQLDLAPGIPMVASSLDGECSHLHPFGSRLCFPGEFVLVSFDLLLWEELVCWAPGPGEGHAGVFWSVVPPGQFLNSWVALLSACLKLCLLFAGLRSLLSWMWFAPLSLLLCLTMPHPTGLWEQPLLRGERPGGGSQAGRIW